MVLLLAGAVEGAIFFFSLLPAAPAGCLPLLAAPLPAGCCCVVLLAGGPPPPAAAAVASSSFTRDTLKFILDQVIRPASKKNGHQLSTSSMLCAGMLLSLDLLRC